MRVAGGRCPHCGDNTRQPTPRHHERCVIDTCDVATIRRNKRGEPWAYDTAGRCVYQPYPNSVAHLRGEPGRAEIHGNDPSRYPGHDPTDVPTDTGRTKETTL